MPDDINLSEEFAYRLLQKSIITRIDVNSIKHYGNYVAAQNEYNDEFEYFTSNIRNLFNNDSLALNNMI